MAFMAPVVARKAARKAAAKKAAGKAARRRSRPRAAAPASSTTATASGPAPASPGTGLPTAPAALTDQRGAPGWYQKARTPVTDPVALANAGGGFLLGLGLWALGLAYLRGGGPEVKRLLAAKFLNRTTGSPAGGGTAGTAAAGPQRVGNLPLNTSPTAAVPRPGLNIAS